MGMWLALGAKQKKLGPRGGSFDRFSPWRGYDMVSGLQCTGCSAANQKPVICQRSGQMTKQPLSLSVPFGPLMLLYFS